MKPSIFLTSCFLMLACLGASETNELDVACAALRDELWDVARLHASRVPDDTGKLIVLESYAREKKWKNLLSTFDAMGYPSGEDFVYYRVLALVNDGSFSAASNLLARTTFKDAHLACAAARLHAQMALSNHDSEKALSILEDAGGDDVETKLMMASIRSDSGDRSASKALWRDVIDNTNASERALAVAAVGLEDRTRLALLATNAVSRDVRRFSALNLGRMLVQDRHAYAEGERWIRETVRDKPDAEGARVAFFALAESALDRDDFASAIKTYSEALEIWPNAKKELSLHMGLGWAMLLTGREAEAMDEFRCAEDLATRPEQKAEAAIKIADALTACGKMQEATKAYQRVCEDYPDTASARRVADVIRLRQKEETGRALYRDLRFEDARRQFEELRKEDPSSRERMQFYEVLCDYGSGHDESAERLARTLATEARDARVRADATHWLAKFAFNRGHWRESKKLFVDYASLEPCASDAPMALAWSARAALADNDFKGAISNAALVVTRYPDSPVRATGLLTQGEALIELGRFDEALLVLDRAALVEGVSEADRLTARILHADALFAMGADNPARYKAALDAYVSIRSNAMLSPNQELSLSFKIAKALEKLKRLDEAIDTYYTQVVLAYRTGRTSGIRYDDAARAAFARAAFRLAEEFESRGRICQAIHVLDLVKTSDVPAAEEAGKRINRMCEKGVP